MGVRNGMTQPSVLIQKYINSAYDNVKLVADNLDSVNVVSTDLNLDADSNIKAVSTSITDVITTSEFLTEYYSLGGTVEELQVITDPTNVTNIGIVKASIADVNTVSFSIESVNTNAANIQVINTVSEDILDVSAVANSISSVNIAANGLANIITTADNIESVSAVGNSILSVNLTAGSINSVNTVASNINNVNTVNSNINNVNVVGSDLNNNFSFVDDLGLITNPIEGGTGTSAINTVANNLASIDTASSNIVVITTVANSITNVNNVGSNIPLLEDVIDALPFLTTNINEIKAFSDVYIVNTTEPTNISHPLIAAGDLWYNPTTGILKVYSGTMWEDVGLSNIGSDPDFELDFGTL